MFDNDPLAEAVRRAAERTLDRVGDPHPDGEVIFTVPDSASVKPGPLSGPMLDGLIITSWDHR